MATLAAVNLVNGFKVLATSSAAFTVSTGFDRVSITHAMMVNYSAGPIVCSVWHLQLGQSEADEFLILDGITIAANTALLIPEFIGRSVNAGGSAKVIAGSANTVSFSATATGFTS